MSSKFKYISIVLIIALIISCISIANPISAKENDITKTGVDYGLASNTNNGTILQAFNCSYNNIKNKLKDIANAGFTTVQTSPVQQPKDYGNWYDVENQWWKLYQPLSFSIARNSWLGSKNDLTSLCTEAHKYGIKIICDIVVNHMANDNSKDSVNYGVHEYEPKIYDNKGSYFHPYVDFSDSSIKTVVQGNIGMPDLNTGNSYVQERVSSLLKECVNCGVDGFRFDAAKHIETPDDAEYKSNFWPTVLNAAQSEADKKNKKLFFYGEILTGCGNNRKYESYMKYMNVTDNETSNKRRDYVNNGNASNAAKISYSYDIRDEKAVLWAESHDTYMDGGSTNVGNTNLNKTFALSASITDSPTLYLVRPRDGMGAFNNTEFKNAAISAANKFHNFFIGSNVTTSSSGNFAISERYFSSSCGGAVIVNCGNNTSSQLSLTLSKVPDGTYKDYVSGNNFTVKNHTLTGSMGNTGVVVIYDPESKTTSPSNTISMEGGTFSSSTLSLTLGLKNATSGTYKIGNANPVTYTSSTTISIGNDMKYGSSVTVYLTATNGEETTNVSYTFKKELEPTNPLDYSNPLTVYLYNTARWNDVYLYAWINGEEMPWPGNKMSFYKNLKGFDMYKLELPSLSYTNLIFTESENGPKTIDLIRQSGEVYFDNTTNKWENASNFDVIPTEEPTIPTTIPTESKTRYLYGDVNLNLRLDISDSTLIQQSLASLITLSDTQKKAANVNDNTHIDISDATLIQQRIAHIVESFPSGEYFYY